MIHKLFHKAGFTDRQTDGIAAGEFGFGSIQRQILQCDDIGTVLSVASGHGADSGEQLAHGKGLGQVIIGAGIQTGDAVVDFGLGRKKKNRSGISALTDLCNGSQTVHNRHHDIQKDGIVGIGPGFFHSFEAVHHGIDRITGMAEHGADHFGQIDLVFGK